MSKNTVPKTKKAIAKKGKVKKDEVKKAHHSYDDKHEMIKCLNRIEGQVRGLGRMIEADVYCNDILHQFTSVKASLDGVRHTLLEAHIRSCVIEQIHKGKLEVIDELMLTIKKMGK